MLALFSELSKKERQPNFRTTYFETDQNNSTATTAISPEEKAATVIQKNVRGFIARKKFAIKQLKKSELNNYKGFLVGNDPRMPSELKDYKVQDEKIALVGTSCFKSLEIACKLGNPQNLPKIVIVDNSIEVHEIWNSLRRFVNDGTKAATKELFFCFLPSYLRNNSSKFQHYTTSTLAEEECTQFFRKLINKYGYDYIRKLILHVSLIKQAWEDNYVLTKLSNILRYHGIQKIFMYPSNIVAYMKHTQDEATSNEILANIERNNPTLTIHTDCCEVHRHPEKVYLFENNDAQHVKNMIFQPNLACKAEKEMEQGTPITIIQLRMLMSASMGDNYSLVIRF